MPSILRGMAYMTISMACFSVMNALVRLGSDSLPTEQVVFLRNLTAIALLVGAMALYQRSTAALKTTRIKSHLGRSLLGGITMHFWYYALGHMPLAAATAISYTTPIFVTVLALIFLKEELHRSTAIALALGIGGTYILLDPNAGMFHWVAVIALCSSFFIAITSLWIKSLSQTESTTTMLFYMALFMGILSTPLALLHWQPMSTELWLTAWGIGITSLLAHSFLIAAYRHAAMNVLMPLDFTRLLFTAALAYVYFDEALEWRTVIGGSIIMAASFIALHGQRKRAQEALNSPAE